jgi:glycosyltransferase involved in cell wall biosynthesis
VPAPDRIFQDLGIQPGEYLLYVSRLEPENNAHRVISAYNGLPDELKQRPLVIVGDAPYAREYIDGLHAVAGPSVIFAGYRFGSDYEQLQRGAYLYIQATEVGGTHPALVEAMGFANCIIANGTPENKEVLGDSGLFYTKNSEEELTRLLTELCRDSQSVLPYRRRALERAEACYSWDNICSDYEHLFREMCAKRR